MAASTQVTFKIQGTSPDVEFVQRSKGVRGAHLVQSEKWFVSGSKVLETVSSSKSEDTIAIQAMQWGSVIFDQGFLEAIHHAYSHHLPLILSPDAIWLQILLGLGHYMDHRSQDLRSAFVDFEGKKQLIIETAGDIADQDWKVVLQKFEEKVTPLLKQQWLVPTFSTTTPHLRMVAQVCLLGCIKDFFACGIGSQCGIPEVTLQGTPADWVKLKEMIDKLGLLNGDMADWAKILHPIVDQFIHSYHGRVDRNFWNRIVHEDGESGKHTITGWVAAFFPFHEGAWHLAPVDRILTTGSYGDLLVERCSVYGSSHVPIKFKSMLSGQESDLMLSASCRTSSLNLQTRAIAPCYQIHLVQLPDGTITDTYDWTDRSVKHVQEFALPHLHPHSLIKTLCWDHQCDKCRRRIDSIRVPNSYDYLPNCYRCGRCDFDLCSTCFTAATP